MECKYHASKWIWNGKIDTKFDGHNTSPNRFPSKRDNVLTHTHTHFICTKCANGVEHNTKSVGCVVVYYTRLCMYVHVIKRTIKRVNEAHWQNLLPASCSLTHSIMFITQYVCVSWKRQVLLESILLPMRIFNMCRRVCARWLKVKLLNLGLKLISVSVSRTNTRMHVIQDSSEQSRAELHHMHLVLLRYL